MNKLTKQELRDIEIAQLNGWKVTWQKETPEDYPPDREIEEYLVIDLPEDCVYQDILKDKPQKQVVFFRYRITPDHDLPSRERVLQSAYFFNVFPRYHSSYEDAFSLVAQLREKGFHFTLKDGWMAEFERVEKGTNGYFHNVQHGCGNTPQTAICDAYLFVRYNLGENF